MIVFVDNENRIKAVNTTNDSSLTALEINDDTNPFNGWSTAKICCYKVTVQDGFVTMMTPYVDSRLIDSIDIMGQSMPKNFSKQAYIDDTEVIFTDMPEGNIAVYFDKPYRVERVGSNIKVSFQPLEEVTTITISIL